MICHGFLFVDGSLLNDSAGTLNELIMLKPQGCCEPALLTAKSFAELLDALFRTSPDSKYETNSLRGQS